MIEFDDQDIATIQCAMDYLKYGYFLEGNDLYEGLEQILTKMKALQDTACNMQGEKV